MSVGAEKLRAAMGARKLSLAGVGEMFGVAKPSVKRWVDGVCPPGPKARHALSLAPWGIPESDWDQDAPAGLPAPALPARVAAAAPSPPPADHGQITEAAAEEARRLLERVQRWMRDEELNVGGSVKSKIDLAKLEGDALDRVAKLVGEYPGSELQLIKSSAWTRLKGIVLGALAGHPESLGAVLGALEREYPG